MLRGPALKALAAIVALASTGCGASGGKSSSAPAASVAPAVEQRGHAVGFERFPRRWEANHASNVSGIAITKDAVITFGGGSVDAFSAADGSPLKSSSDGCMPLRTANTTDGSLTVACTGELRSLDPKTLAWRTLMKFHASAIAAAFSADEIFVEHWVSQAETPHLQTTPLETVAYDRTTLKPKRRLPAVDGLGATLAASEDGLLVGAFAKSVQINRDGGASWRPLVKGDQLLFAVPAPSGQRVFLAAPSTGLIAVDVKTATVARKWSGEIPMSAEWIGDEAVAVIGGSGGVRILELTGTEVTPSDEEVFNSLAVAPGGDALCAHSIQTSRLTCYFAR
ncbi:MAG: hypothetical protein JNL21_25010 [Myxococcales bacterium]|nr:hypothetical protein [Myxococcales bacterium]